MKFAENHAFESRFVLIQLHSFLSTLHIHTFVPENRDMASNKRYSIYEVWWFAIVILVSALVITGSCKHDHLPSLSTGGHDYNQVNLVADTAGFGAARIDTNLDNPWGIAIGSTGSFWISNNHSGTTGVYDGSGNQLLAEVGIPFGGADNGASPSGVVYNNTTDFIVPVNGKAAKFIYVTEDGIITAWNKGDTTILVADRSASNTVYKGVAIANDGTGNFIYAVDFHNAKVDVFDKSFNYVPGKTLADPNIPVGFAPFNIQNIGGALYVTYAKQKGPENMDDQDGTGYGYVDIYTPGGTLVKRFASQGSLNSPWGIAKAPAGFGQGAGIILIANFGDGRINVFDTGGNYKGQLDNNGIPVFIDGLWAITFPQTTAGGLDTNTLYFTAGPQQETYGIFGYLKVK